MKTNFRAVPIVKTIEVDGVMMTVPLSTRYIAIDRMGYVWAWKNKPTYNELLDDYLYDGRCVSVLVGAYEDNLRRAPQLIKLPACA